MIYKYDATQKTKWFVKNIVFIVAQVTFGCDFTVHNRGYTYDNYYDI